MRHHQHLILKNWTHGIRQLRSRFICQQRRRVRDQNKSQDLSCQSGPSTKNSVIFSGGDSSKNYGADQQRLQISELWQIPYASHVCLLEDKVQDRGVYLFPISYGSYSVDQRSGDGWFSGCFDVFVINTRYFKCRTLKYSMRGLQQHWTESSIILTSKEGSVWRNKKAQKEDRFLRGRQIAYLIYDHFRVTGDSVENYTDLFTIVLRNDDIQEFDSKGDGIFLSMTKIPHDEIMEGLYKLRVRESEKLKTVLELYNMEIHQKKLGPDNHWLNAIVKRSIEQDIRNKNFGARNKNYEKKRRGQESKDKTACAKKSWRLVAMGNQRAVCRRRQLQFPPRYE